MIQKSNIFYLDKNPYQAARYYPDNFVAYALVECLDTLSYPYKEDKYKPEIYGFKHINWINESISNWSWLLLLGMCLCVEYNLRFKGPYSDVLKFRYLFKNPPGLPIIKLSEFPIPRNGIYYEETVNLWRNYIMQLHCKYEHGIPRPTWFIKEE